MIKERIVVADFQAHFPSRVQYQLGPKMSFSCAAWDLTIAEGKITRSLEEFEFDLVCEPGRIGVTKAIGLQLV